MRKVLVSGLVALCLHCGAGAQGEWSPPKTSLPEAFIEAAARMHRLGLASGKGGEYRKFIARIPMNIPVLIIPDAPQQQTGWVLPRRKGEPLRAVGWDGLVYEVDRLGPRANLLEDVQAWPKKSPGTSRFNVGPRLQGNLLNLAVLLLAGEVRLVERLSTKIDPPMEPFGQLLLSFLWNLESRALRAHVWGFHEVALHDLELIDSIGSGVGGLPQDFLADTRRRVTSRTPKLDLSTLKRLPQQRRIQLLVNALEDVRHDTYDPIVLALEREGDPAVDSLLWAMEKDTRLTRISGFNSAGAPTLRSVSSVASSIVSNIIGPTAEPKTLSARERWSRVRPMSRVQRALHVLSEEYAEPQLWAVAAQNLLVKWNLPLSLDYLPAKMPRPEPKALTPATIELLERRALRSLELGQVWQAQLLARVLTAFDERRALPLLRKLTSTGLSLLQPHFVAAGAAIRVRLELGDESAFADLETLLMPPSHQLSQSKRREFTPIAELSGESLQALWIFGNHPRVQKLASAFFDRDFEVQDVVQLSRHASGPMIRLKPFREFLLRVLDDDRHLATFQRLDGSTAMEVTYPWATYTIFLQELQDLSGTSERGSIRLNDYVAGVLGQIPKAHRFNGLWPTERKDEVIGELKKWIALSQGSGLDLDAYSRFMWQAYLRPSRR